MYEDEEDERSAELPPYKPTTGVLVVAGFAALGVGSAFYFLYELVALVF